MSIIGIVAIDENGAIGRNGSVPWHYPSDLRFFKEQTTSHVCVMGRRTWHSLKRPLKGRLNVVLSKSIEIEPQESVIVLRDIISVLALGNYLAGDLFVIGGEQIYRSFLPHIDKWIITKVPLAIEDADTFMPEDYLEGFQLRDSRQLEENLQVGFYERPVK